MNQAAPVTETPLRSTFATDPDMMEILVEFVNEMPQKATALVQLWESQQLDELRRLAHQLKGASGGYGFPTLGKAAGDVEETLVKLGTGNAEASLERLRVQFNQLVTLVKRVSK